MRQEDCFCYKILIDEYISGHIAMNNIKLIPLEDRDREQFILDNQEAFNYGALEEFGRRDDHFEEDEQIISRETIEKSIDNGEVKSSKVIDTGETGHGALAGFLQEAGANVMICGGIGGERLMPWQNPESRFMPVHPELLMKLLNPIWKELLQRLARLHAIIMITSIMETINVDMVSVTISFQFSALRSL